MSGPFAWIRVDARGLRSRTIGSARGLTPAVEQRWRKRVQRARDEVREAHLQSVLPHGRWWREGPVQAHPVTSPLLVLGEPGAVRAATLGISSGQVETSSWARDFGGMTIRVDGAPQLPGDGDPSEDLRFGAFGPVAEGIRHAVLGEEGALAVAAAIQSAAAACGEPATDPALDMAAALAPAAFEATPVVMLAPPDLLHFAQWWAGALVALTCKPATDGPNQVSRGLSVCVAELGDEAALQASIHADPTPCVVLLSVDGARMDVAAMREATLATVSRAGQPHLDVRLGNADPTTLLPAAWVALESALATAVAIGVEPLTMNPGEDLRMRLDSGGGAPT